MITKLLLLATVSISGVLAHADSSKMIDEKIGPAGTDQTIHYQLLSAEASPAAAAINAAIRKSLLDGSCEVQDNDPNQLYYDATAQIREANANYVSFEIATDEYCGGAHPNTGTYYIVSDARTGEQIDMNKEVPAQDLSGSNPDFSALDRYQKALAKKMVAALKASGSSELNENSCLEGLSMKEKVNEIASMFPTLAGLSKGKIIATISPAHVAAACTFEIEMSLKQVNEFIRPDSVIRSWLRPSAE